LQDAQVPPALLPVRFQLFGLGVKLNGKREVLLVAGGGGAGGDFVESGGSLANGGTTEDEREEPRQEEKAACGSIGEAGDCHVLPEMGI